MTAYRFDGSFDGLLCCIFRSFSEKETPFAVFSSDFQPSFDTVIKDVATEPGKAERVKKGIIKCGSISLLSTFSYAMRSGDGLKETVIFNAIRKCIENKKDMLSDYADYDMLAFYDLTKRISFETHRFKGFLRFEECLGGGYYAHFEPDNDVCDLLAPHFKKRFPSQKFIIHDVKRNKFVLYDGERSFVFCGKSPLTLFLSAEEKDFQSLWKTYYDSVNIKERYHPKQQDNYLPRRYRKNMTEFR